MRVGQLIYNVYHRLHLCTKFEVPLFVTGGIFTQNDGVTGGLGLIVSLSFAQEGKAHSWTYKEQL